MCNQSRRSSLGSRFNLSTPSKGAGALTAPAADTASRLEDLKKRTKANFEKLRELKKKAGEQQLRGEDAAEEPTAGVTPEQKQEEEPSILRSPSGKSLEQRASALRRRSTGSGYAQQGASHVRYVFKWPAGSGPHVYLEIAHGGKRLGTVVCKLYRDKVPLVADQFQELCEAQQVRATLGVHAGAVGAFWTTDACAVALSVCRDLRTRTARSRGTSVM